MKLTTNKLLSTEKLLITFRGANMLTEYGQGILTAIQNAIVNKASESIHTYKFMSRYRQLLYYNKLPIKKAKKKAHKIRHKIAYKIPVKPRKIRLAKSRGKLAKKLLPLGGRRKRWWK
jgi:hypothetical protein